MDENVSGDGTVDLAERRKAAAPNAASRRGSSGSRGGDKGEKRPPLWRWFSAQVAHSDPLKAAAARLVRERWDLPLRKFSTIDRALAAEDSEHLLPFRMLLDEYRLIFAIEENDDAFARETGAGGLLVPFAPEICDSCYREAVPGTGKCGRHGGQWISPQDIADISHRIHDRLITLSEAALRVLGDLMDNARSEQVRMLAATAILDRAGVGPHMNVNHSGEVTINAADQAAMEIRKRLDQLAANAQAKAAIEARLMDDPVTTVETEVVEAEVVEA